MLDSKALTKIQSIILIAIIVVAAVGGGAAYVLLSGEEQTSETIKIGVLGDLDAYSIELWQSVILAAEQINAEGGLLGRQVEVIGEDNDGFADAVLTTNALTKLITQHKVDFVIGAISDLTVAEIIPQHKKIYIATGYSEEIERQMLAEYDKYKYFFNVGFNSSSIFQGMTNSLLYMRDITGFNKIGYIGEALWAGDVMDGLDSFLPENGFELVYEGRFPFGTFDFSSYFAAAEAAGVEAMVTLIGTDAGIPFVKEYYDRQSPIFLFGGVLTYAAYEASWEWTEGKCEDVYAGAWPVTAAYPFTSKTLPTREAYMNRWGTEPSGARGYEILRFILADAIERAGTIETEAVIKALEETSIETANARNFEFTPSHGVMMGTDPNDPEADFQIILGFQWQDGKLVPVDPPKIMEEAGATYTFPDWPGPWDNLD